MLKLIILFAAFVGALGAAIPKGMLPQLNGRIVEGVATSITSFPWQISLQRSGRHFCGGSIHTNQIIVTAAHCLQHVTTTSVLKVRAGSSFWISGGVLIGVAAFKYHEQYNEITMVNDIAIIRLSTTLSFSSTIRPISLASVAPPNGAAAAVSGWGTTQFGSSTSPTQLKYVDMKILSRRQCASSVYGYGSEIGESMICTYSVGKDSCQGDSGGPLVSGGVLVGVVSWGIKCASPEYPGVYADVADLHTWVINAITGI